MTNRLYTVYMNVRVKVARLIVLLVSLTDTRLFFYKNKLYKNTQAEIYPKIKNKLRTITRLKFWSEKFKKFTFILVHRLRCTWTQNLSKFSLVIPIGRWKSDMQVGHVRERSVDSFKHIFLSAILHILFGATNSLSGNKNNLRTIWGWNRQKIENIPAWAESYWFL